MVEGSSATCASHNLKWRGAYQRWNIAVKRYWETKTVGLEGHTTWRGTSQPRARTARPRHRGIAGPQRPPPWPSPQRGGGEGGGIFVAEIACLRLPVAFATQTGADPHRQAESAGPDPETTGLQDYTITGPQDCSPGSVVSDHWSLLCGLRLPVPARQTGGLCGKTETFGLRAGVARDRPACCPRSSRHPAFPLTPAVC